MMLIGFRSKDAVYKLILKTKVAEQGFFGTEPRNKIG
jgi:hypothetical protein